MRRPLLDVEAVGALEPYLRRAGEVFARFLEQDSGCRSSGVAVGAERWFVKTARVPEAEQSPRRAIAVHRPARSGSASGRRRVTEVGGRGPGAAGARGQRWSWPRMAPPGKSAVWRLT
jgi:hypothetical protein